jgi:hypothetical protein
MRANGIERARAHDTRSMLDNGGLCVDERADGYYWKAKGVRQIHGPFDSLVDALDDIQREAGADLVGEPEDWIEEVGYEAAYPA